MLCYLKQYISSLFVLRIIVIYPKVKLRDENVGMGLYLEYWDAIKPESIKLLTQTPGMEPIYAFLNADSYLLLNQYLYDLIKYDFLILWLLI